jgi:predicted PurR-regulated permease PerM
MEKHKRDALMSSNLRTLVAFFSAVLGAYVLYRLSTVLVPLFVAFLLAYALDPFVDKLERLRLPRVIAAPIVVVALFALVTLAVVALVPMFVDEVRDAGEGLPAKLEKLVTSFDSWLYGRFRQHVPRTLSELAKAMSGVQPSSALGAGATALFGTLTYLGLAFSALVIPLFSVYLLIDFDRIVLRSAELVPRRYIQPVTQAASEINSALGSWVRGQLTSSIVLAALYATGLRIIDIRLAIPIGIITGLLAFIPYVGFSLGFLLAITMTLLDWSGFGTLAAVVIVMGTIQLLDGLIITPRIVGSSVGLSALEVLVAIISAGALFGFLGVLLAVPIGAVTKILLRHARAAYLNTQFYRTTIR